MKKTVLLIVFLIVSALGLLIFALYADPAPRKANKPIISPTASITPVSYKNTILTLSPMEISLNNKNTFSIDINIDSAQNQITAVQLELAYDPKILTDVRISKGTFFPAANVLLDLNDTESGRISYALALPPTQSPITGTGNVAKFTARVNPAAPNSFQTTLSILEKSLVSALGVEGSALKETRQSALISFENKQNSSSQSALPTQ